MTSTLTGTLASYSVGISTTVVLGWTRWAKVKRLEARVFQARPEMELLLRLPACFIALWPGLLSFTKEANTNSTELRQASETR